MHIFAFAFAFASTSSFAARLIDDSESFPLVPSWYAGISVAHNQSVNDGASDCDGLNGIVDGLHLGYQFNSYLMTEVEYQYLGCMVTIDKLNRDITQVAVSVKFGYPMTDNITFYLKTGLGDVRGSGITSVMGGGMYYQVLDDLALNIEYQYSDLISNDSIAEFGHQRFSLGIQYRFGRVKSDVITIKQPILHKSITEKASEVETFPQVISSLNTQTALFENNSSTIIDIEKFFSIVTLLKDNASISVRIIGHTDNVGSEKYNQWLSEKRAKKIGSYLVRQGINSSRIIYEGKGELEPITSNVTVTGRERNRRVTIEFN